MKNKTINIGSQKMNLYYPRPRKIKSQYNLHAIGSIGLKDLYENMKGMKLMTLQDLLFLMENQHLIPEEWKKEFDWKTEKFNRIFFFGDMPWYGWEHRWFQQVPFLYWRSRPWDDNSKWEYGWTLYCGNLYNSRNGSESVAVHENIFSNHVFRFTHRISKYFAEMPERIRQSNEREKRDREFSERIYHEVCRELGPFWMP